jgi:RNA polymerase sigma-70 factor (ECF subfamily)
MVADKVWMEGATGTLRWRSHRTTVMRDEPSPRVAQFADLYEEHARAVLRYCQLRIADPHEAEDAAALIFTRAFAAWPPADPSAARSWLFTIAHNVVANHYRQKANRGHRQSLDVALELHDPAIGPLDHAIERERSAELRAAITQLSDDQRDVVELRLAGLTGPEIAASLGKSHAAVKMLQLRAVQKLRILLDHPNALDGRTTDES